MTSPTRSSAPSRSSAPALAGSRTRHLTGPDPARAAVSRPPMKPVAPAIKVVPAIVQRYPPPPPACKTGRVAEHLLERSQRVEVPAARAFDLFADARNLEPMTPPWLHFQLTTPQPVTMAAGTLLDYRLRLHGVPIRWRTRIETWEPPLRFSDTMVRGPYALWEHTHSFEPDGEHACTMHDRVRYAIPLGPLGELARRLFVRRDLERIFDFRRDAFAAHFG